MCKSCIKPRVFNYDKSSSFEWIMDEKDNKQECVVGYGDGTVLSGHFALDHVCLSDSSLDDGAACVKDFSFVALED